MPLPANLDVNFSQASLSKAEEHPDTCNLEPQQILELYEKGILVAADAVAVSTWGRLDF